MTLLSSICLAVLTSSRAIAILLNSPEAVSRTSYDEAYKFIETEAAKGKPLQQFVFGVTTKDQALSQKYIAASKSRIREMAEKTNNSLAWYLLSVESNDLKLLRKAADGGNVQALNALGTIATQKAFSKDLPQIARENVLKLCHTYFSKAAAQGDPNGYINVGTCYQRGLGCEVDLPMAFTCFQAAAEAGHPEGMDFVSACYELGHGVQKDARLSLYWRMRARALRGDESAKVWLRESK